MTSKEIKEELGKALSKVDITDRARCVLVVFHYTLKGMVKEDDFEANPKRLFKQQYYKWTLVCEELIKDGFDIPKDLFAHMVRVLYPANSVTKELGWDKLKDINHELIEALKMFSLVFLHNTQTDKAND